MNWQISMSGGMSCEDEDKVGRVRMDSERPDLDDY
jgi:hypothetical protein